MRPNDIMGDQGPSRVFAEHFSVRILNGVMHLKLRSGEDEYMFAIPAQQSKALARAMSQQIEELEKKSGMKLPEVLLSTDPVPSPIKPEDINNADEEDLTDEEEQKGEDK